MKSLKTNRIILIASLLIMIVSIALIFIIPPYNYAKLDRSNDQFKLLYTESPTLTSKPQSDGLYDHEFSINVVNTTDSDLENVVFYIYLEDENGVEGCVNCEPVTILANMEMEKFFQSDLEYKCDTLLGLSAQIGDGEEFEILDRDVVCPTDITYTIVSVVLFISLIAVIVVSIRVNKISKKHAEIEAKAYENRVNEMIDLQIRRERVELEKQEGELGVDNNLSTRNSNNITQLDGVRCAYCGHVNKSNDHNCSVCGAQLKK